MLCVYGLCAPVGARPQPGRFPVRPTACARNGAGPCPDDAVAPPDLHLNEDSASNPYAGHRVTNQRCPKWRPIRPLVQYGSCLQKKLLFGLVVPPARGCGGLCTTCCRSEGLTLSG